MRRTLIAVILASLTAALAACGGSSSHFDCCLNGAYYSCPDQAAFDNCTLSSPSNPCSRDASEDSSCTG